MKIQEFVQDFINLVYPKVCCVCGENLYKNENMICTSCIYQIPRTNFHKQKDNPVEQLFWGRINIENATAFFYYYKGTKYQKLMHKFKYQGKKEIGYELGYIMGHELNESCYYKDIDLIVPVPLHPRRQAQRGYNQSEWIARGLADAMKIPINNTSLFRAVENPTQTKKSKYQRWENVASIFKLKEIDSLSNKHILLVDDIITTGSTIEACAIALKQIQNVKLSIATLAFAAN